MNTPANDWREEQTIEPWASEYLRLHKQWKERKLSDSFFEQATIVFIRETLDQHSAHLVERIREEINHRDTTTGFNAQYNDQFHEAKGYNRANLETLKFLNQLAIDIVKDKTNGM
jgi:hypothetical protein